MKIYLDTCIWLNYFKKDERFTKDGKNANKIIRTTILNESKQIFYSGFVLRELENKLKDYIKYKNFLQKDKQIIFIKATPPRLFFS